MAQLKELSSSNPLFQVNKLPPSQEPIPPGGEVRHSADAVEAFADAIGVLPAMIEVKPDGQLGLKAKPG